MTAPAENSFPFFAALEHHESPWFGFQVTGRDPRDRQINACSYSGRLTSHFFVSRSRVQFAISLTSEGKEIATFCLPDVIKLTDPGDKEGGWVPL